VALTAEIGAAKAADRRDAVRRTLRLQVDQLSVNAVEAVIRNLSEDGLLLETAADLTLGERLDVVLPGAGIRAAVVVWSRQPFFGCEFKVPVSKAVVSAALLRAPSERLSYEVSEEPREGFVPRHIEWSEAEPGDGTKRVLMIALALLFWFILAFLNLLMPVPA
jgi:hypothetical protein